MNEPDAADAIEIRPGRMEELFDLRHRVLRPHLPREAAVYDVDALPETRHFIALAHRSAGAGAGADGGNGRAVVGTVTIFPRPLDERETNAWQLRGMAVADDFRRAGVGRKLLAAVDRHLRSLDPVPLLWCHARITAIGFYERCGWQVISDVYDVPTVGPHRKMIHRP